jgi:hypothetical protein
MKLGVHAKTPKLHSCLFKMNSNTPAAIETAWAKVTLSLMWPISVRQPTANLNTAELSRNATLTAASAAAESRTQLLELAPREDTLAFVDGRWKTDCG